MRFVEPILNVGIACLWIYFAVASYGSGERLGPIIAFYGMLMWAQATSDFQKMSALAKQAGDITDRALDALHSAAHAPTKGAT